jgi:molecular chaperone DnaK
MAQPPIGIDLGTTYSVVATVDEDGEVQILDNAIGQPLTPSAVYFETEDNFVVGQNAKEARADEPTHVIEFIKRQMGTDTTFQLFDQTFTPVDISGIILKKLREDAEAALNGEKIHNAVITCPAYFGAERRDATEKAANLADLNVLALVNEPTAAAVAFGMGEHQNGHVLVFDLGGGTFDITVLNFTDDNAIDVLVSDGDHELGGKDFDDAIMRLAIDFFLKETGYNLTSDATVYAELRDKAEKAKKQLTEVQTAKITLSVGGNRARFELQRAAFEEAIEHLLEQMRGQLEDILDEANLTKDDIVDIILVGGSTYVPAVRQMVEDFFGKPPNRSINPDEAVACGAALYAAKLMADSNDASKPQISEKRHLVSTGVRDKARYIPEVHDIVNHSLGVKAVRDKHDHIGYNAIILERGAKLPAENEDTFYTLSQGQTSVASKLFQGETEDIEYVKDLGEWEFDFGQSVPEGTPITVKVSLDRSGIIRVTVTDPRTKRQVEREFKYDVNMSQEEVQARAKWLRSKETES